MTSVAANARLLKALLIEVSPLIEEFTAQTCPQCRDVCCKQRRGFLDAVDVRYVTALGQALPFYDVKRPQDGPCQFMELQGCGTPRWLRPWRCTWYFCDPLLDALDSAPPKKSRNLSALIQKIVDLRSSF